MLFPCDDRRHTAARANTESLQDQAKNGFFKLISPGLHAPMTWAPFHSTLGRKPHAAALPATTAALPSSSAFPAARELPGAMDGVRGCGCRKCGWPLRSTTFCRDTRPSTSRLALLAPASEHAQHQSACERVEAGARRRGMISE